MYRISFPRKMLILLPQFILPCVRVGKTAFSSLGNPNVHKIWFPGPRRRQAWYPGGTPYVEDM
jgi:hypothetical protein